MENKQICRDIFCTDAEKEYGKIFLTLINCFVLHSNRLHCIVNMRKLRVGCSFKAAG